MGLPEAHMILTVTRLRGARPIDRGKLLGAVPDRKKKGRELRSDLGIPQDAFVVMFSGKFSGRKSPIDRRTSRVSKGPPSVVSPRGRRRGTWCDGRV